jgi:DHA1 family multidrug resistance protein-like MFS transporter
MAFRAGLSLMLPILPVYLEQIGGYPKKYESTTASLLFVAVALSLIFFTPLWGRRADFWGPGRTFVLCCVLGALFFPPYALAGSALVLILIRIGQGVFIAGIMPSAYSAAARLTPTEQRGAVMGLKQSSMQLAMAMAPAASGPLAAILGLKALFWISCGLFFLAAALARIGWMNKVDWKEARSR